MEQAWLKTTTLIQAKRGLKAASRGVNWVLMAGSTGLARVGVKVPRWAEQGLPDFDAPDLQTDLERRKQDLGGLADERLREKILQDLRRRTGAESNDPETVFVRAAQTAAPAYRIDPKLAPMWLIRRVSQTFYYEVLDKTRRAYRAMDAEGKQKVDSSVDVPLNSSARNTHSAPLFGRNRVVLR